ncbi:MAG: hypothetical protein V2A74_13870, partial [bacterium]
MKTPGLFLFSFYFVCVCFPVQVFADRIVLKDGREIEGRIRDESSEQVVIEFQGVDLVFPRSNVKSLEKASAADNALSHGDELLAAKKFKEAITVYKGALQAKPEEARAKIAAAEKALAAEAGEKLEKDLSSLP